MQHISISIAYIKSD